LSENSDSDIAKYLRLSAWVLNSVSLTLRFVVFLKVSFSNITVLLSCHLNALQPSRRVYKNGLNTPVILIYFLRAIFGPKLTLVLMQGSEAP
jgi:hypothetical protein